jgi:hypothetical protein
VFNPADRVLAEIATTQHSVFTTADARKAGLSDAQIRRRAASFWERLYDGVFRIPGAVASWTSDLAAATFAATPPAGVARRAAAQFYDLPGPDRTRDAVEIICRRWQRVQPGGLIVHESTRLGESDLTVVDGISIVTPEFLVLQLAGMRPFPDYVERVLQAARRKRLITYDSMLETFNHHARRGVHGVRALRAALELWDPRSKPTHSDMETMLVQILRDNGLPELVTQFVVLDQFGNFVAQTDGALPRWKITIEYQSMQEHTTEFQLLQDDRRRNAIIAAGYLPLGARREDLRTGGKHLVEQIRQIARRHAS